MPRKKVKAHKISLRQKFFVSLRGPTLNLSATSAEATFKSYGTGRIPIIMCGRYCGHLRARVLCSRRGRHSRGIEVIQHESNHRHSLTLTLTRAIDMRHRPSFVTRSSMVFISARLPCSVRSGAAPSRLAAVWTSRWAVDLTQRTQRTTRRIWTNWASDRPCRAGGAGA